ncbi:MAG: hypothetical protein RR415_10975 [Ruthenibacterium sp.]
MSIVLGIDGKISRGTAGTKAIIEMTNVADVTVNLSLGEADVTTRAGGGWKISLPTLFEASVEFDMFVDPADEDYTALAAAYFAKTPLSFFVDIGNGEGLDFDGYVGQFNLSQPLSEGQKVSISIKPTTSSRVPQWGKPKTGGTGV